MTTDLVTTNESGVPVTTSLKVAEVFGKEHKNVLRDIQLLGCSKEFNALNFELVKYWDLKGELRPMYEMTRDGFTLLVMGFTGKKAMEFKERYIEAFNNMEMELKKRAPATINWEDPQQIAGLLVQAIQVTQDQRAKIEEQKTELEGQHVLIEEMKPDVEAFKRLADSEGLYTVRAAATALQTNQKKLFGIISDLR